MAWPVSCLCAAFLSSSLRVLRAAVAYPSAEMSEILAGEIERVTFFNEESGFAVLRVRAKGRRELAAVLCRLPAATAGEWIEASGQWVEDREHGLQFKADDARTTAPSSRAGIERFLGSGLVKGIGPVFAKKLVARFGEKLFEVIENESARLEDIPGVGAERRRRIKVAWTAQRHVREIMVFLHTYGVGTARAQRIWRTYGDDAIAKVRADPWKLARDITGIGFRTADAIAQRLGLAPESPPRLLAGLRQALLEAAGAEGHAALPREELLRRAVLLLEVDETIVAGALGAAEKAREIICDPATSDSLIYLPHLHLAETGVAKILRAMSEAAANQAEPSLPRASQSAIGNRQSAIVELSPSQRAALETLRSARISVLTGGPGVGKTTLLGTLLDRLAGEGKRLVLAAPTGRAAQRLAAASGREAHTLHRLLEARGGEGGGFQRGPERPLEGDFFVVDESSMLDLPLAHALLRALPRQAALLLVGDVDQLPSVGPGLVLRDVIESGLVPVARLTEVFRQAEASHIIRNAHRIRRGELPEGGAKDDSGADFFVIPREEPAAAAALAVEMVAHRIPRKFGLDPRRDVQVLCAMKRGPCGTRELNRLLQAALNPPRADGGLGEVERFGWTFREGDRVLQTSNNYDKAVFNGDIGLVHRVDAEEREVHVRFEGRPEGAPSVVYDFGELDELAPAFAITVHKSQGSEFPAVVMALTADQFLLLQRNLLYTGVTRGRKLVVLTGQPRALARAVRETGAARRFGALLERLRGENSKLEARSSRQAPEKE